jgi:hypothetical protein
LVYRSFGARRLTCFLNEAFRFRGRKRKYEDEGEFLGGVSSCSTTTVVAGSWLILVKKMMISSKVELMSQSYSGGTDIKIRAADISITPAGNALMLVDGGEYFKTRCRVPYHPQ